MSMMAAIAICASAAAVASDDFYTATLAQPLAAKKAIVADGNIWRCEGSGCILTSRPNEAQSLRSCQALQREVGALLAYGTKQEPFDSDKLAKCNSKS